MGIKESCGIFGIYGNKDVAGLVFLGLFSLQHRGQESAGIISSDGAKIYSHLGLGLVNDVFNEEAIRKLKGHIAIGHVRYSTTGSPSVRNIQPFLISHKGKFIAIAHNGNLVNAIKLKQTLESEGAIFQTTTDSELIVHLIIRSRYNDLKDKVRDALSKVEGAYSLLILTEKEIIAARDPHGFRPLSLGTLDGSYVLASETCAFDIIGAQYIRDIQPGEIFVISENGTESQYMPQAKKAFCIFEFIYFARPDSLIFERSVYLTRKRLGESLFREYPIDADAVLSIPDSGNYAALGYAQAGNLPFEMGIIRNHYIGRTFIQPFQNLRDIGVKIKLNPIKEVISGKRVVVVEDSIVRGTTSKHRISTIRLSGAKEIHMMVSCPPIKFPCFYGIDFPTQEELIASHCSIDEIRAKIGVDSLNYLSLDGMLNSMLLPRNNFCVACFTGEYPVEIEAPESKYKFEL